MKRIFFLLSLCALFSVSAFGQRNKPSACPSDVTNLKITFDDGEQYLYKSDGQGSPSIGVSSYVNQKLKGDQIEILFQRSNCTYDLTMNLNFSKRSAKLYLGPGVVYDGKFFNFDRIASVPVTQDVGGTPFTSTPFCTSGWYRNPDTGVVPTNSDGTVQDNYAGCHADEFPTAEMGKYYVRRSVGSGLNAKNVSGDDYGFRYQMSPLDNKNFPPGTEFTSYVRVYHPSASVWYIIPDFPTSSYSAPDNLGALFNRTDQLTESYHRVPFKVKVELVSPTR